MLWSRTAFVFALHWIGVVQPRGSDALRTMHLITAERPLVGDAISVGGTRYVDPFSSMLAGNRAYVARGAHRQVPKQPSQGLAVITCMDSRLRMFPTLGLDAGDAHIIRSAGGRVTDDVLRALTLSTHTLGTRSVAIIGHTDCGLRDPEGKLLERLTTSLGRPPAEREWLTFSDPVEVVRQDCALIEQWEDRPDGLNIGGYMLDIQTGVMTEVVAPHEVSAAIVA